MIIDGLKYSGWFNTYICVSSVIYCVCMYFSTCLAAIRRDDLARKRFHPKHTKNSQSLKNVAEYVMKCAKTVSSDGYPSWYIANLAA